ncbi:hypothetical protein HDU78_002650 [Chytriomyces hyalinus]|nr:hypothetical protein HDU78_002650 [Chytriomyces hyalinus]
MGIPMYKTGGSRRRRRSDGEEGDVRCTRRRRAKSCSSVSSGSSDNDWNARDPGDRTSDGALVGFLEEYATGAAPASAGDRAGYSPVWMQRMGWADSHGQSDSNENGNTSFANSSTPNNRRDRFIQTLRAMRNNAVSSASTLTTLHSSLSAINTINIDNINRSLSIRHSAPSPDDMASIFINADGVESERPASANNDQNSTGNSPAPRVPMNEETLQSLRQLQRMAIRNRQPSSATADHPNRLPMSGDQSNRPSTRTSFRHRQAPDVRSRPATLTSRFNLAPSPTTTEAVTGAFSTRQVLDMSNNTLAPPVPARLTASRTADADTLSTNSFQTGVRNTAFAMERIRHLSDTLARHTAASFSDEESPTSGNPGVASQARNSSNLLSSVMFASPRSTLSGPAQRPSASNSPANASQYTLEGFEIAMARIRERSSARHARTQHPALENNSLRPLEPIGPAVPVAPTFSGAHLDAVTVDRNAGPFVDPMSPAVFRPIYSNGRARLNRNEAPLGAQPSEGRGLPVAESGSLVVGRNMSAQVSVSNDLATIVDGGRDTVGVILPQSVFPNSGGQSATPESGSATTPRSNVAAELQREFTPTGVHRASLHSVIESVLEAVRMPQSPPLAPQFSLDEGISSAFAPALGIVTQASNSVPGPETLLLSSSEIRLNTLEPSPNSSNPSANPPTTTTAVLPPPCINVRPSQSGSLWSSLSEAANLAISLSPPLPSSNSTCPVNGPAGSAAAGVQIQQLSPPLVPLASTASISPSLGPRRPSNFSPGFGPIRRVVSPRVPPNTIAVIGSHGAGVMASGGSAGGGGGGGGGGGVGIASAPLSAGMNVPTELPPAAVETVSSVSGPSAASTASGLQLGVGAPVIGMRRERAAARPVVSIFSNSGDNKVVGTAPLPAVFTAPIRADIVNFVHTNMAKNKRQAYSVNVEAGHQTSAVSWGTGRAVARIPRVSGTGTHRAGQAAFGNMCRGGRMFAPTKTWRKWHVKTNVNQKRFATASAVAASALPSLVLARGHKVEQIHEIPLVLAAEVESLTKSKEAVALLKAINAYTDVEKVVNSKKLRAGKGKLRNRRHRQRRGPLVIYNEDQGIVKAFRNIPGVELAPVSSLNLLQLAPGGHVGRFVIWTAPAFERLDSIYGTKTTASSVKKGYKLPQPIISNADLPRLINSDEVQAVVRPAGEKNTKRPFTQRKNPLKNMGVMVRLNPYAQTLRRAEILGRAAGKVVKKSKKNTAYIKSLLSEDTA